MSLEHLIGHSGVGLSPTLWLNTQVFKQGPVPFQSWPSLRLSLTTASAKKWLQCSCGPKAFTLWAVTTTGWHSGVQGLPISKWCDWQWFQRDCPTISWEGAQHCKINHTMYFICMMLQKGSHTSWPYDNDILKCSIYCANENGSLYQLMPLFGTHGKYSVRMFDWNPDDCVAQCQLFLSDIRWLWNVIYFWCSLLKPCLFHIKLCLSRAETLFPLVSSAGLYGPDEGWASAYPECRERNQSPINIVDHDAKVSTEYQEITLEGFESESSNKTSMKNTGKTGTVKTMQAQAADWNFQVIPSRFMGDKLFFLHPYRLQCVRL